MTLLLAAFVMFNILRALLFGKSKDHEEPSSKHTAFPNLDGTGTYQIFADAKICKLLSLSVFIFVQGCLRPIYIHLPHPKRHPK